MKRTSQIALVIFVANTLLAAVFLWDARPRTFLTMDEGTLDPGEREAALGLIHADGVNADRVRICRVGPCTRGPALFVDDHKVRRLELPRSSRPGPLVEAQR